MPRAQVTPKEILALDPSLPPYPARWAFLAAYEKIGTVTGAADAARVARTKHYDWLKEKGPSGDAYRKAFAVAHRKSVERLEEEARRRAVEGDWELVTHNGNPVMVGITADGRIVRETDPEAVMTRAVQKRRKSDALLIFLLKGGIPEKYAERQQVQVSGPAGGPIQVEATVEDKRIDDFAEGYWRFMELSGAIPGQQAVPEGERDG